jgi:hypothetical protein
LLVRHTGVEIGYHQPLARIVEHDEQNQSLAGIVEHDEQMSR